MRSPACSGIRVTLDNPEPQALDGERKTVTALFADIKGSMELIQDLHPGGGAPPGRSCAQTYSMTRCIASRAMWRNRPYLRDRTLASAKRETALP